MPRITAHLVIKPEKSDRMRISGTVEWRAMLSLFLYNVIKFILGFEIMRGYAVNPWIYLVLDVFTTPPYVVGTVRLVNTLAAEEGDLGTALFWSLVLFASFFIPYFYLAWAGCGEFPAAVRVMLGLVVIALLVNLVRAVRRRVNSEKAVRFQPETP